MKKTISDHNTDVPRKRGRPRKNQNIEKKIEKKKITLPQEEDKEIIVKLDIPIEDIKNATDKESPDENITECTHNTKSSSESRKNVFTTQKEINAINNKERLELTLSDESTEKQNDKNTSDLLQDIKEKNKTIRKLKDELLECKNIIDEYSNTTSRSITAKQMNVNLIHVKDGKQIIQDKTDIACWWCTYNFDNSPCFIPERYYNGTYYVFGCFCSFGCAVAYNLSSNDYKVWDRHSLIKKLYGTIYNTNNDIIVAPPKEVLQKFGGTISIEEFRKNTKLGDKEYRFIMPPMISIIPVIEEKYKDNVINRKLPLNKFSDDIKLNSKKIVPQNNLMKFIKVNDKN